MMRKIMGACAVLACANGAGAATVRLTDYVLAVDGSAAAYTLTFDRAPALHTYDAVVRAQDSFTLDILPTQTGTVVGPITFRVISGEYVVDPSISPTFGRVAVPDGYVALADAGNHLLSLLPATLTDATLQFQIPLAAINQTDGKFDARLISYAFGGSNYGPLYVGTVVVTAVPLPAAAWTGLSLLGLSALFMHRRRTPTHRHAGT